MDPTTSKGPLAGLTVLDLSRALAGPHAAMMLGDLGARVIKVEAPDGGDDTRKWGPPFVGATDRQESTYFLSANRNKESIALDLKDPGDLDVLHRLIARSDVLIENFRTGVMDRLGLDAKSLLDLNPRLIILSITGFGHDGPEAGRPGYDQIVQGEAGLMSLTGADAHHVQKTGVPIADLLAGIHGALGAVAALLEQARTGAAGQVVRTSLLSSVVGVHAFQGTRATVAREVPVAQGNHHPSIAPYGLFRCRGGSVQLAVGSEGLWRRFCLEFGIDPARPGFASNSERVSRREETIALIEEVFARLSPEELLERLTAAGVPAGAVRSLDDVYASPQVRSQGLLVEVQHESLGPIELPGPPLRFFSVSDGGERETTKVAHHAPPRYDGHGAQIRAWLADGESP